MKTICLFAIHRTGTNYLGSVLKQFPSLAAFDEVFHERQVYGLKPVHLKAIANLAGREFTGSDDPALIAWARANPLAMVEVLQRVARRKDKQGVYFKVFVHQWQQPLEDVAAALAREPGFVPVILQRRCLDVYVSYRKAEAAGAYKHVDTTDHPVTLDAGQYAHWARPAREWYQRVDAALRTAGVEPVRARYEQDLDRPADDVAAHWSRLLGLAGPVPALDRASVLQRQDRSDDLAAKVANLAEFTAALRARGLWDEAQDVFLPGNPWAKAR